MQPIEIIFNTSLGIMTVLSLALTIISLAAFKRTKNERLVMITGAFLLFFVKGIWISYISFHQPISDELQFLIPVLIIDTIILIIFYISALKR